MAWGMCPQTGITPPLARHRDKHVKISSQPLPGSLALSLAHRAHPEGTPTFLVLESLPSVWDSPRGSQASSKMPPLCRGYDSWPAPQQHENLTLKRAEVCPCRGHGLGHAT